MRRISLYGTTRGDYSYRHNKRKTLYIGEKIHPQTLSVVETRAEALGLKVVVLPPEKMDFSGHDVSGVLVQYPDTEGNLIDYSDIFAKAHEHGVSLILFITCIYLKYY